ncbi:MAG: hypothetical protein GY853_03975 [PVC group bacterium]|nr:hypothetical protein [PVC group bacterium]
MRRNKWIFFLLGAFLAIKCCCFAVPEAIEEDLNLKSIFEINLPTEVRYLDIKSIHLGENDPDAILLIYSSEDVDPWCEAFFFPKDTLKIAVYTQDGTLLWSRDLGPGVIPGKQFCPVLAFDLDKDGKEEVWFINNVDQIHPLSLSGRRLECLNGSTGKTIGQWPWPDLTGNTQPMGQAHRNFILGGYVQEDPVLITAQGIYGPMFIQAWSNGMKPRWELRIGKDTPGARGTHKPKILDWNTDGIDELFWGERCINIDTGTEIFCADRDSYKGHSDIIDPFQDSATGKWYVYTCRESDLEASPRVVVFDDKGNRIWGRIKKGHIDQGWVANIGENRKLIATAIRIKDKHFLKDEDASHKGIEQFSFDAFTGEEYPLSFSTYYTEPGDINGDGYDEIMCKKSGEILNWQGKIIGKVKGRILEAGRYLDNPKLQVISYSLEGIVNIFVEDRD